MGRRAASLSTYAGDTALPGGRVDHRDGSLEDTARREAFEEARTSALELVSPTGTESRVAGR